MTNHLRVGGIEPLTTVDFPGKLAAVVFCQGCPWRCTYCHNAHLQLIRSKQEIPWNDCLNFLKDRVGFLEAVVFSGGEPTMQYPLLPAIQSVRDLGFEIGLHTAGMFPDRLKAVLPLVHWIGFDVKAPLDSGDIRYEKITGLPESARTVSRSLDLVIASGTPVQVRTTMDRSFLDDSAMEKINRDLSLRGLPETIRQACRSMTRDQPNVSP
jgi:pyruvate formate lyase activating enzyme